MYTHFSILLTIPWFEHAFTEEFICWVANVKLFKFWEEGNFSSSYISQFTIFKHQLQLCKGI